MFCRTQTLHSQNVDQIKKLALENMNDTHKISPSETVFFIGFFGHEIIFFLRMEFNKNQNCLL